MGKPTPIETPQRVGWILSTKTNTGDAFGMFETQEPWISRPWMTEATPRCKAQPPSQRIYGRVCLRTAKAPQRPSRHKGGVTSTVKTRRGISVIQTMVRKHTLPDERSWMACQHHCSGNPNRKTSSSGMEAFTILGKHGATFAYACVQTNIGIFQTKTIDIFKG